jgi:hypothetical protein
MLKELSPYKNLQKLKYTVCSLFPRSGSLRNRLQATMDAFTEAYCVHHLLSVDYCREFVDSNLKVAHKRAKRVAELKVL